MGPALLSVALALQEDTAVQYLLRFVQILLAVIAAWEAVRKAINAKPPAAPGP